VALSLVWEERFSLTTFVVEVLEELSVMPDPGLELAKGSVTASTTMTTTSVRRLETIRRRRGDSQRGSHVGPSWKLDVGGTLLMTQLLPVVPSSRRTVRLAIEFFWHRADDADVPTAHHPAGMTGWTWWQPEGSN
jgi:hypothetical protein